MQLLYVTIIGRVQDCINRCRIYLKLSLGVLLHAPVLSGKVFDTDTPEHILYFDPRPVGELNYLIVIIKALAYEINNEGNEVKVGFAVVNNQACDGRPKLNDIKKVLYAVKGLAAGAERGGVEIRCKDRQEWTNPRDKVIAVDNLFDEIILDVAMLVLIVAADVLELHSGPPKVVVLVAHLQHTL